MKHARIHLMVVAGMVLIQSSSAADYYLDPVTGNRSNPGTAAKPWSTLAAVFAASPVKTFQPGDHLYLRRGDHGTVVLSGINTGDVFIEADAGHTPAITLSLLNARHWYIKGLTILGAVDIDNQKNENSHDNTFENCYLPKGGFRVCSSRITLRGNHIRNGGIHFQYHSNNGLVTGNTIEDFFSDAMNMKGNHNVFEYNLVMNSHKVSNNHNDMFQGWASKGNVLRGNEFRAFSDPNQPDLVKPGLSDVQGISLFDGWYEDWIIENNVLFVDHAIGIWLEGAKRCIVRNNTVVRCGQNAAIPNRPPNIRITGRKPGKPNGIRPMSVDCIMQNNVAERFEWDDSVTGQNLNNIIVGQSAFGSTFVAWAKRDLRLKPGAANVIDHGSSANTPPTLDADGKARPSGAAWVCGAFEYGPGSPAADTAPPSKPNGLRAMLIAGYGVDLQWTASTDNRKVTGYDIFRNGTKVGRTRAGTNYLDINADTTDTYTVQAFDHSDNRSAGSESTRPKSS
jgi:parallel beta-helix repeat protein